MSKKKAAKALVESDWTVQVLPAQDNPVDFSFPADLLEF
jgi:hypothetical protein